MAVLYSRCVCVCFFPRFYQLKFESSIIVELSRQWQILFSLFGKLNIRQNKTEFRNKTWLREKKGRTIFLWCDKCERV